MKITLVKLLILRNSLQSLDNFKFNSNTTYTLSRNLNWVENEIAPLEKTRIKLFKSHGEPTIDNDAAFKNFITEWEKILEEEIDIKDLRLISLEDLNIGSEEKQNPISIRILNGLFPILKENEE